MNLLYDSLHTPMAAQVALTLLHFVWQAAAIAAVLIFLQRAGRIENVETRYALSLAALVLMAAAPLITFAVLQQDRASSVSPAVATWSSVGPDSHTQHSVSRTPADSGVHTREREEASPTGVVSGHAYFTSAAPWLVGGWMLGVAWFSLRLGIGIAAAWQMRRGRRPLPAEWEARAVQLGRRLGLAARRRVYVSAQVTEALCVGLLRPIVLFPASWVSGLSPEMLTAVLAHELAHIRRLDLWVNFLQRVVETLLFYHPAVWWLSGRLRIEREMCCDQLAVGATERRVVYATMLEFLARLQLTDGRPPSLSTAVGGNQMRLLERVQNVLKRPAASRNAAWWPAGLLALAIPLGAWALSNSQSTAVADDDAPAAEREGDRPRDGERPDNGERLRDRPRDGDRERGPFFDRERRDPPRREGDRPRFDRPPRDGDRPRGEGPRDGDRPRFDRPPREGDRPPREFDRPPRDGERPPREGDRPRFDGPRDGDRPHGELSPREREMMAVIRRMQHELEMLRREVHELRRERGHRPPPREGEREFDRPREGRSAFEPREREERREREEIREREERREREEDREREREREGDRERE